MLHGCLAVKQLLNQNQLIGIPLHVAEQSAGDYDGDMYNIIPCTHIPELKKMVKEDSGNKIPNPKIPKFFTPRIRVGNYAKIMELRKSLLERWITIANVFNTLSIANREALAEQMFDAHILADILGDEWATKLEIDEASLDDKTIVIAEIQLGIKLGTDAFKTKIPMTLVEKRTIEYEQALRQWNSSLSVPYGKGLMRRIKKALESANKEEMIKALELAFNDEKGVNIVHKAHRALVRYIMALNEAPSDEDYISSDDEANSCSEDYMSFNEESSSDEFYSCDETDDESSDCEKENIWSLSSCAIS